MEELSRPSSTVWRGPSGVSGTTSRPSWYQKVCVGGATVREMTHRTSTVLPAFTNMSGEPPSIATCGSGTHRGGSRCSRYWYVCLRTLQCCSKRTFCETSHAELATCRNYRPHESVLISFTIEGFDGTTQQRRLFVSQTHGSGDNNKLIKSPLGKWSGRYDFCCTIVNIDYIFSMRKLWALWLIPSYIFRADTKLGYIN